ncbi:MAG TPA: 3-deoxy-manno-octulosonate cytidylyltransferase [Salinivirgaceae bacterium]|nr:3-deoxy-manno-octulosonate cytidylyltransferase [Salinivirgaceae bacterium]
MQYLALIPARYASTRFPGKPLVDILGKPMIQHVFERTSRVFQFCAVATDNEQIAEVVSAFEGTVIMTSPDHQSGTDRCAEALEKAEEIFNQTFDVVINVQGDEPFLHPSQLEAIKECFVNPEVQIATLIKKIDNIAELTDVNKPKAVIDQQHRAIYFSRHPIPYLRGIALEQWLDRHTYYKHIGLYAYRSNILQQITRLPQSSLEKAESLEQLRWIENGFTIHTVETTIENLSIDTPQDLEKVLNELSKKGKTCSGY